MKMSLVRLLVSSALYWLAVCAATTIKTGTTTCIDCKTIQQFIPLSSMPSLVSLDAGPGFANEHMTALVGYPIIEKVVTGPLYGSTTSAYLNATNSTYTTASTSGTLAFAYNDTFYTHRWWPSVGDAVPNDSAFFDARCTATAGSAHDWVCSSWSVTVVQQEGYTTPVTTNATNSTTSTVVAADKLYTVIIGSIVVAPALSTAPANGTSTTSYRTSASSVVTRTMTYPAMKTSKASLNKAGLGRLILLTGLLLCYLASI